MCKIFPDPHRARAVAFSYKWELHLRFVIFMASTDHRLRLQKLAGRHGIHKAMGHTTLVSYLLQLATAQEQLQRR